MVRDTRCEHGIAPCFPCPDCDAERIGKELTIGYRLALEVVRWAKTPGNHGGNPYANDFVQTALKMLERESYGNA